MKKFLFALLAALALTVAPVEAESNLSSDAATVFTGPVECRSPFSAPQCSARPYDTSANLAYPGNGAQPAVALNTIPGYSAIHQAQFVNDGFYGNGTSWIGTTANSWIKVDLGCAASVDSVRFGRDRLGAFDDRDPGQVTILGAVNDVYANGDAADDSAEYTELFDSAAHGYTGAINGSQTLKASFGPTVAQYLKIQFRNGGAAIDEIEVMGDGCDTTPPNKDACKNGGWRDFTDDEGTAFRNQGDCVSYVATGGQNPANG